jgi:hypothetical protein
MYRHIFVTVLCAILATVSCGTSGKAPLDTSPSSGVSGQQSRAVSDEQGASDPTAASPAPVAASPAPAAAPAAPARQAFYTGDGGRGKRLAVLQPAGKNISQSEQWLLTMIQGTLTADFQKYSAMTITDRQNLDAILDEQALGASGNFSDDDYIGIGKMTNAQYILTGSVTKLPRGYMLELAISNTESGERAASFAPRMCSAAELEGLSAVKEASADLLSQMGVELTDGGRSVLMALNAANVSAESALARGIIAQRSGSSIEAMANYYEAAELDPTLLEATMRRDTLGEAITSGNIGENIRNDIQRRQAWIDLMTNCENYFKQHLPYDIIYDNSEREPKVDYQRNTAQYSYPVAIKPTSQWQIVSQIIKGLIATKKGGQWGIVDWPLNNDMGNVFMDWRLRAPKIYIDGGRIVSMGSKKVHIEAVLRNSAGQIIASSTGDFNIKLGFPVLYDIGSNNYDDSVVFIVPQVGTLTFNDVRVGEILDPLSVEIVRVDGNAVDGYARVFEGDTAIDMRPYIRELESYASRFTTSQQRRDWWEEREARRR